MKIRLDQITSTPKGMVMGVQIRGPKDSWLRFAILEVPFDSIPAYVIDDYWEWMSRKERPEDLDAPLPLDWGVATPPA